MRRRTLAVGVAAVMCAGWAVADSALKGKAETVVAPPLPGVQLVGQGMLRFWGLPVYRARLWAEPGFRAEAYAVKPLVLELEYLRAFSAQAIAERSLKEMRRLGSFTNAQAQRWQKALQAALPDVKSGDRLLGLHQPGVGAQFLQNGRVVGELADPQFAALFFGIWLSPATSEPALRDALLAGALS